MDLRFNPKLFIMASRPQPQKFTLPELFFYIKRGKIRIPDFQRDIVWNSSKVESLLESISKGYPIGFILLWNTKEKLNEHNPLGLKLSKIKPNAETLFLLDGQQRLVNLFGIFHRLLQLGKRKSKYTAFYNMDTNDFKVVKNTEIGKKFIIEDCHLSLDELINLNHKKQEHDLDYKTLKKFEGNPSYSSKYHYLYGIFSGLEIPAVIVNKDVAGAIESFERLNTKGTPLKIVDIMVAKTYNKGKFNLKPKLESYRSKLQQKDFDISDVAILQCMASCISEGTGKNYILKSAKNKMLEKQWGKTTNAIELAIDFLTEQIPVPVSSFLPHEIMLSPLTYFFYNYGNKKPPQEITRTLKRYFWFSALSGRYFKSQDTSARDDIKNMKDLIENSNYNLFDYHISLDTTTIKEAQLKSKSPRARTILCLFSLRQPREFMLCRNPYLN